MKLHVRAPSLALLISTFALWNVSCQDAAQTAKSGSSEAESAKSASADASAAKTTGAAAAQKTVAGTAPEKAGTAPEKAGTAPEKAGTDKTDGGNTTPPPPPPPKNRDEVQGYRLVAELDGDLPKAIEDAIAAQKKKQYKSALEILSQAVNMRGTDAKRAEALVELGDTLFRQGKDGQSELLLPGEEVDPRVPLQAAADIFDEVVNRYSSEEKWAAIGAYMAGSSYMLLGDHGVAFGRYKLAYGLYPKSAQAPKALMRMGVTTAGKGDARGARAYYSLFIQKYGKDPKQASSVKKVRRYLGELSVIGNRATPLRAENWLKGTIPGGLADLQGEVVVLTFFMTGCGFCKNEMPKIRRDIAEWTDRGVVFLGCSDPSNPESTKPIDQYLREQKIDFFDTCIDNGGYNERPYKVLSYPAAVVIDRKGRIRWRGHYAFMSYSLLAELVKE